MIQKLYREYSSRIYRNYRHIRGTWRAKHILQKLLVKGLEEPEKDPESIFSEDWDTLLILDACRHDLYEEVNGPTEKRTSLASKTPGFISATFSERDCSDTVLVTGNPHYSRKHFKELTGREVEEVFHEVFHTYQDDWDYEENTVMPETLIRDAETARKLFPDKKIIIHFMQPHYPFVNSELEKGGIRPDLDHEKEDFSIWQKAEMGDYSKEELWKTYKENLEFIMAEIEEYIEGLEGKTVITSDHGNLVGENGLYGHPGLKKPVKQLREVPWDVRE